MKSMKSKALGLLALASLLFAVPFTAAAQEEDGMTAEQFVQSLHFRSGPIEVPECKGPLQPRQRVPVPGQDRCTARARGHVGQPAR